MVATNTGGNSVASNSSQFAAIVALNPNVPVNLTDPAQWRLARFWDTGPTAVPGTTTDLYSATYTSTYGSSVPGSSDLLAYWETVFMTQNALLNGNVEITGGLTLDASPPIKVPAATTGQVLVSDSAGNMTPGFAGNAPPPVIAPAVVTLTDAATVTVNATLGNDFRLTTTAATGATRTIGNPSGPVDGQAIAVTITQDAPGDRLVTWGTAWQFPDGTAPILSTTPGFSDILRFVYYAGPAVWMMTVATMALPGTSTTVFFDDFGTIPSGNLPSAAKWAIANGGPFDDPTNGAQWYEDDPSNVFVDSSGHLNLAVTVNGGGTTTAQARGNYVAPRISTFIDRSGTNNGAATLGAGHPWSIARTGFQPFTPTYGTLTVVAKMTTALGFWPAIWCLAAGQHWPVGGEIDLMENFGGGTGTLALGYGNVIGAAKPSDFNGYDWQTGALPTHTPVGSNIADGAFHTYVMSLNSTYTTITMTYDGVAYTNTPITKTAWLAQANTAGFPNAIWPFGPNSPLGIVLNVCVGDTVTPPPTGFPAGGQTFPFTSMVVSSVKWTIP